jgi:hypothetical protein
MWSNGGAAGTVMLAAKAEGSATGGSATTAPSAPDFAGKPIVVPAAGAKSPGLFPVNTPTELYNLSDKELLGIFEKGVGDIPSQLPGSNGAPMVQELMHMCKESHGHKVEKQGGERWVVTLS